MSASPPSHRRSPLPADRPPERMLPSRCRTGTSSASPSPTSSLISASPGNRLLLRERVLPPSCLLYPGFSPRCPGPGAFAPPVISVSPAAACCRSVPLPLASKSKPSWALTVARSFYHLPSRSAPPVTFAPRLLSCLRIDVSVPSHTTRLDTGLAAHDCPGGIPTR